MDKWLKNNNALKILSIVLALMLWLVVNMNTNPPTKSNIPEQVNSTYLFEAKISPVYNENQFVVGMPNEQISVRLKGQTDLINQIRNGQNFDKGEFFVDLTKYEKAGTYQVPVNFTGFPTGVEVEVQPSIIEVRLVAKYRKEMDVIIDKLGQEAEGYQSGDPIINPKKVHISGTTEQVEKVAFIKAFINIDNINASISQQIPLKAIDKNGNVIQVEIIPQTIEIQIPVTSPNTTIPFTYKIEKYPPSGYAVETLNPLTQVITIYGPKEEIEKYSDYPVLILDLSNTTDNQIIKKDIPLNDGLLKIEPGFIEFEISITQSVERNFNEIPIEILGLGEGLQIEIINPQNGVNITLEGAPKILETIKEEDLHAFIDVADLLQGEHEIPIQYNVPILTKLIENEVKVQVKIIKE